MKLTETVEREETPKRDLMFEKIFAISSIGVRDQLRMADLLWSVLDEQREIILYDLRHSGAENT